MKLRHAAALAIILIPSNGFALTGEQYLPQTKVQLVEARKLAIKTYRGKIISEELEQEPGGSGLRYSFVVRRRRTRRKIGIDAKTGAILGNSPEN